MDREQNRHGNHHIDSTTADAEATKIEAQIKAGHPEQAAQRLRNDAAVLNDESYAQVAHRLREMNEADRKDPTLQLPEVHIGDANWGLNHNKVDGVQIGANLKVDTDQTRQEFKENPFTVTNYNAIEDDPTGKNKPQDQTPVVTSNAFDKYNMSQYETDQNGRPKIYHVKDELGGTTDYVNYQDSSSSNLHPGALVIPGNNQHPQLQLVPVSDFRN